MRPLNWPVALACAVTVAAFALAAWSFYQASINGERTRTALCQVLLAARRASLTPPPGEPPLSAARSRRAQEFYAEVIALVEGCRTP